MEGDGYIEREGGGGGDGWKGENEEEEREEEGNCQLGWWTIYWRREVSYLWIEREVIVELERAGIILVVLTKLLALIVQPYA